LLVQVKVQNEIAAESAGVSVTPTGGLLPGRNTRGTDVNISPLLQEPTSSARNSVSNTKKRRKKSRTSPEVPAAQVEADVGARKGTETCTPEIRSKGLDTTSTSTREVGLGAKGKSGELKETGPVRVRKGSKRSSSGSSKTTLGNSSKKCEQKIYAL
jgi:hypothetical protein